MYQFIIENSDFFELSKYHSTDEERKEKEKEDSN